ncbi:iron-containing alcohol dehydrogenase PsrA [Glaciimonas soli]|uniref:Iron-containing alcohol dehydrogenase n=1 Tax=Glaciimonas soli TaxID=2590999 RepID=A0A843YLZ7_9BURK|nr:iron-containing alcohol dehydrogenase PsrA [Glaciimonas soli]MQR00475.1 iron-containing alcohol dehydrogenase [Glaciimonas soli]
MTQRYFNPVATHFGPGSLEELPRILNGAKVVVVTFPEARSLGLVKKLEDLLGEQLVYVIENVLPNPDVAQLAEMYNRFWQEENACDTVVALGGGSAIDTAKALIVGTESGNFDELLTLLADGKSFAPSRAKTLIAIPTTAGTGSEVTPWATIWDAANQKKYSLHLECTWPKAAIVDPDLMLTLPKAVTISTGLDALSHALEAIWNVNANSISDTFAIEAIHEIIVCLPLLARDLGNKTLRSSMALAAMKAGLAFSNTKTALAHSISYEMTLRYGLPHGIACSFTLPLVLDMAWGERSDRDATLQKAFNSDRKTAVKRLRDFLHQLEVRTEFSDYGVSAQEAQEMIQHAMQGARGKNFIGTKITAALS